MRLPAQSSALSDHSHALSPPGSVGEDALQDGAVTSDKIDPALLGGTPTTVVPDAAAANGAGPALAMSDHTHAIVAGVPSDLTRTATSAEGAGTSFARNDHTHATDDLAWGIVDRDSWTTSEVAHSVSGASDMVLPDVVVSASRLYAVHMCAQWDVSGTGVWTADLRVDGVVVGRFATSPTRFISAAVFWEPTAGTKDLDVYETEVSGTATSAFSADASSPRQFWVEDIGPR